MQGLYRNHRIIKTRRGYRIGGHLPYFRSLAAATEFVDRLAA